MNVKFTKMHGAGNDFVFIEEWGHEVVPEKKKKDFVASVCDRHFGVGADGAVFVQKNGDNSADAFFNYYNSDGSTAEMCGNGIRCFAKYLYEHGLVRKETIRANTRAGIKILNLTVKGGLVTAVKVDMGPPQIRRGDAQMTQGESTTPAVNEPVKTKSGTFKVTAVGMGNPHAIVETDDAESYDIRKAGAAVRYTTTVWPKGVNVHAIQQVGKNEYKIRTYERGVEDETLACGTGICASAVASVLLKKSDPTRPILFHARGGDITVEFKVEKNNIVRVYLIGPAAEVFTGNYPST
ncbi:Diaminopimelate epimerase [uncultured archaeon]|nr:Diaminopimelate epimerase [uncultured archaeon]